MIINLFFVCFLVYTYVRFFLFEFNHSHSIRTSLLKTLLFFLFCLLMEFLFFAVTYGLYYRGYVR